MTFNITQKDVGYCTGLYEGEGNITFVTRRNRDKVDGSPGGFYRQIKITIGMTDEHPLDLFWEIIGVGQLVGPYRSRKNERENRKPMYYYHAFGLERVQHVVCIIWEYLSPRRREQITEALRQFHAFEIKMPKKSSHWRSKEAN